MARIGEVCSSIFQIQSPSKLQNHRSFSIPCYIAGTQIKKSLRDLGASVSLMTLSLCKKLELSHLRPTTMLIQLADGTLRQSAGVLEDFPVQVGKFIIPCDFIVMDMDENPQIPIILGRSFLATTGAMIDVKAGTISFQFCGGLVDFCFPPPLPSSVPAPLFPPEGLVYPTPHAANSGVTVLDGDRGSNMRSVALFDLHLPIPTALGGAIFFHGEVLEGTPFITPPSSPPSFLSSSPNLR